MPSYTNPLSALKGKLYSPVNMSDKSTVPESRIIRGGGGGDGVGTYTAKEEKKGSKLGYVIGGIAAGLGIADGIRRAVTLYQIDPWIREAVHLLGERCLNLSAEQLRWQRDYDPEGWARLPRMQALLTRAEIMETNWIPLALIIAGLGIIAGTYLLKKYKPKITITFEKENFKHY